MSPPKGQGRSRLVTRLLLASALFTALSPALAADPPRQVAQYAHTSWTARDGASLGLVFAMAQTPDGYLWIAGSLGLFRFDGHQCLAKCLARELPLRAYTPEARGDK